MEEMNYIEEIETVETENEELYPVEVETEESGIGAGMVALITAGVVAAGAAAIHWGKKAWRNHKAKKALRKPDEDLIVEVADEDIEEITTPEDTEK